MRYPIAGILAVTLAGTLASAYTDKSGAANVDKHMSKMDANGDGQVSREEHARGAQEMFVAMDADKDGSVTASEMEASHGRNTGTKPVKAEKSASEKIKAIDHDDDGKLTAAEHRAGAAKMFEEMDKDSDGVLTKEELAAGHAKKMHKD
jgi:Ca2+-binding EF-hand superfamily protein